MMVRVTAMLGAILLAAGCAGSAPAPAPLTVRGELTYRERIALPAEATARIEIREYTANGSSLVAERRIDLAGRQVPIPFELEVDRRAIDPGALHELRGVVSHGGFARRATEPKVLNLASGDVRTGELHLRPLDRIAFGTAYLCGDVPVRLGRLDDAPRLVIDGRTFRMRTETAGSIERLVAVDDPATIVRRDGESVTVRLSGRELPECSIDNPAPLPLSAGGNEPGWHVELNAADMKLVTDYGESTREMKLLGRETEGDTTRFRAASDGNAALVSATATICRDSATGMPHPYAVVVQTRDGRHVGCGGKPSSLLAGREWVVEDLDGRGIIDSSRITLEFDSDGRVSGGASCNRFTAQYTLTGEALTIESAATTRMACPEALMNQERRFLEILEGVVHFDLDTSGALVLQGTAGSLVAR
ncbi:MAG: hypothetical protein CMP07_02935 [Xanthomonadales bacterium]|nr:hypothetical protein [Xanthomonadales bacterium]